MLILPNSFYLEPIMTEPNENRESRSYTFASSVKDSSWHSSKDPNSYELWRFSALSDDGEQAVAITFIDDLYVYRGGSDAAQLKHPAIDLTYFRGGKVVFRQLAEFEPGSFSAELGENGCSIAGNSFTFRRADYGSGYLVSLNLQLSRLQRIELEFEWLSIETDLMINKFEDAGNYHYWNVVAPRSDVSGKFTIYDSTDSVTEAGSFRGTGVHDHIFGTKEMLRDLDQWYSGIAHFDDSTVIFSHFKNINGATENELIETRDGTLIRRNAKYAEAGHSRTRYGMRYPKTAHFTSDPEILIVKPVKTIFSNVFMVRLLSEITLISYGSEQRVYGVSEMITPKTKYSRWLLWLNRMNSKEGGRMRFLP